MIPDERMTACSMRQFEGNFHPGVSVTLLASYFILYRNLNIILETFARSVCDKL